MVFTLDSIDNIFRKNKYYISDIGKSILSNGVVNIDDITVNILELIKSSKLGKTNKDVISLLASKNTDFKKSLSSVDILSSKHDNVIDILINQVKNSRPHPVGINYITFNPIEAKYDGGVITLVATHKSRVLNLISDLQPIKFNPKKIAIQLKVIKFGERLDLNTVQAIKLNDKEQNFVNILTIVLSVGIIVCTAVTLKSIDRIQNARIATKQLSNIQTQSNEEIINSWVEEYKNGKVNLGLTIHPEYFVSDIRYFDKTIEELIKHTDNIEIINTNDKYLISADITLVSQYSSIVNAPIDRPDIKSIKEQLKASNYLDEEIRNKLGDVQYQLFSDFCFIDTPNKQQVHIELPIKIEDGEVKNTFEFLDMVLDTSGIRNNIEVFDKDISKYMYNLTTDSGKEVKQR